MNILYAYYTGIAIVLPIVVLLLVKIIQAEKKIDKLIEKTDITQHGYENKTPFEEDLTETSPGDYSLSNLDPVNQKMIETLPKRFSKYQFISKGGMGYIFKA